MVDSSFSIRLHAACDAAGIKQLGRAPELMRRLQARGHRLSVQAVRKWFDGESLPRSSMLSEIAIILKVSSDELLTGRKSTTTCDQVQPHEIKQPDTVQVVEMFIDAFVQMDSKAQKKLILKLQYEAATAAVDREDSEPLQEKPQERLESSPKDRRYG